MQLQLPLPGPIDQSTEVRRWLFDRIVVPQVRLIGDQQAQGRPRSAQFEAGFAPTRLRDFQVRMHVRCRVDHIQPVRFLWQKAPKSLTGCLGHHADRHMLQPGKLLAGQPAGGFWRLRYAFLKAFARRATLF